MREIEEIEEIKEINGNWYLNGINLYASSLEDAERRASCIRPVPTEALPAGSLRAYTSGSYDRNQTTRRGRKGR